MTIIGMYLFAAEVFGEKKSEAGRTKGRAIGLLVAALVALSVFQIRYAWEVRMYTLGTALTAFSSWALFRALRDTTHAPQQWIRYGLITLLLIYTHHYALFSIAAQGVFTLGYFLVQARGNVLAVVRSSSFRQALLAAGLVGVGWLPW